LPTIELADESVEYGLRNNVPVVVDLRDMWPDIFVDRSPDFLKPVVKALLFRSYERMHNACSKATSLFGITEPFLEWGLGYAGRARGSKDAVFPLANVLSPFDRELSEDADSFWKQQGLALDDSEFVISYVGAFRPQIELGNVIEAVSRLKGRYKLVLAGTGDELELLRQKAKGNPNVIFPGWIDGEQICSLLRASKVGLAPYRSTMDFMASIPNKPIEYFSGGLPVLSSLKGVLEKTLAKYECGLTYSSEDPAHLAQCLETLMNDESLRLRMSENALNLYNSSFKGEKVYREMADHIERLVPGGQRVARSV
jgi:glycosyltransferase involved in cell wall biosynthesis